VDKSDGILRRVAEVLLALFSMSGLVAFLTAIVVGVVGH
jgi:hypothetical protein